MPRNFLVVHGGILLSPFVFRAGFSYAQKKAGISQSRLRNVLTFLHQAQDDSLPASPGLLLLPALLVDGRGVKVPLTPWPLTLLSSCRFRRRSPKKLQHNLRHFRQRQRLMQEGIDPPPTSLSFDFG